MTNPAQTAPAPKPRFKLEASSLGPIRTLTGELSHHKRNLVFANNGTGKSFISRTLQLLERTDLSDEEKAELIEDLVQQECMSGEASLALSKDMDILANISLSRDHSAVTAVQQDYIFSVFNSHYVEHEVRQRKEFEFEEEIEGELIIGSDSVELEEAQATLEAKKLEAERQQKTLTQNFARKKEDLIAATTVSRSLREFQNLAFEKYVDGRFTARDLNAESTLAKFVEVKSNLKKYDQIPEDATAPQECNFSLTGLDLDSIFALLADPIAPAQIAEEFKSKITNKSDFIKMGVTYLKDGDTNCPFCEQSFGTDAKQLINAYVSYFSNREAKAKEACQTFRKEIEQHNKAIEKLETDHKGRVQKYDELKGYVVELKDTRIDQVSPTLEQLRGCNRDLLKWLKEKEASLSTDFERSEEMAQQKALRANIQTKINHISIQANDLIQNLSAVLNDSTSSKREAKREACRAFEADFYAANLDAFDSFKTLSSEIATQTEKVRQLTISAANKVKIEERVFATFERLLEDIFGEKYSFDRTSRRIKLSGNAIRRKSENTFSDGEKNIIGLCYFLAELHTKVSEKSEYQKLFVIIDDPVSSLSFNYIYSVLDVLKKLRVDENDGLIFRNQGGQLVPILLLTHNDHLFNMAFSNNIFDKSAAFQLCRAPDNSHVLSPMKHIITPHYEQLKHVLQVADSSVAPEYFTPNSIRSVMEGMWKFCRPDLQDFGLFVQALEQDNLPIRSLFLNALSHGNHHYDRSQFNTDMRQAAIEAKTVVEKYASGQLKKAQEAID